jgi:hypothetical protein
MTKISLRSDERNANKLTGINKRKLSKQESRESLYTDRDFMIKESKEDDETPFHDSGHTKVKSFHE